MLRSAAFVLALGCSASADVVYAPVDEGVKALIWIQRAGGTLEALAVAVDEPTPRLSAKSPELGAHVFVVEYSCPLEALGLSAGPLSLGRGAQLPRTHRVYEAVIEADAVTWAGVADWPAELSDLRVAGLTGVSACARLAVQAVTLPGTHDDVARFCVAFSRELAIAGTLSGRLFAVTATAARASRAPSPSVAAAGRDEDGYVWLVDVSGVVHRRLGFDGADELMPKAPVSTERTLALAVGSGPRLFLSSDQGSLAMLAEGRWELLDPGIGQLAGIDHEIAQVRPDEALAVSEGYPQLRWVRDRRVESEPLPDAVEGESPIALAVSPGRVLVGTSRGRLLEKGEASSTGSGQAWLELSRTPSPKPIRGVAPLERQTFFGGDRGMFHQASDPSCEGQLVTAGTVGAFCAAEGVAFAAFKDPAPGDVELVRFEEVAQSSCSD